MEEDKVEVTGELEDFAELFDGAPPFKIDITYHQICMLLDCIQVAGTFAVMTGQELEQAWWDGVNEFKDSAHKAMQAYLGRERKRRK